VTRLRVVTYNIHRCRGMDGRCSPGRILEVLREIDADLVALQEVLSLEGGPAEKDQARYLAAELGMNLRVGQSRSVPGGWYGNAVLSRLPLGAGRNYDLSVEGREKRGCIRADVELGAGRVLHLFNLHLGTALRERRRQGRLLIEAGILENRELLGPRVVVGDFNDWTAGLASKLLEVRLNSVDIRTHLSRSRTYPGLLPLVHLDHVYFCDRVELEKLILHRTRRTLMASDHLPLVADFRIPSSEQAALSPGIDLEPDAVAFPPLGPQGGR
jgi:endonuclease/exonuclease/phosphatase family metal-dependent hydrolase